MDIKNPVSLKINVAYQVPACFKEETVTLSSLKKKKGILFHCSNNRKVWGKGTFSGVEAKLSATDFLMREHSVPGLGGCREQALWVSVPGSCGTAFGKYPGVKTT